MAAAEIGVKVVERRRKSENGEVRTVKMVPGKKNDNLVIYPHLAKHGLKSVLIYPIFFVVLLILQLHQ